MPRVDRVWPASVEQLKAGDMVKKTFLSSDGAGEGLWVLVKQITSWGIIGPLLNPPSETYVPQLEEGSIVAVNLFEIIDWVRDHK